MKVWTLAATAALSILMPATLLHADDKPGKSKKIESAREESEAQPKGKKGSSDDLTARVDSLERQVRELAGLIKQQMAHKGGGEGDKHKPEAKPIARKGESAREEEGKHEGSGIKLLKGPNGELYVPLSALPPGLQMKYAGEMHFAKPGAKGENDAHEKHATKKPEGGEHKKGEQPKRKPQKENDDD